MFKSFGNSEKLPFDIRKRMFSTLLRCGDRVDINGWRTSVRVGTDKYEAFDLDEAWWAYTKPKKEPIYVDEGIMLLAIVYCGYAPIELWSPSFEISQMARIPVDEWASVKNKYNL